MLKKQYRLTKNKDFEKVFKQSASAYAPSLGLKITVNNLERPRFAILVSKKVSKKAVDRNKIKRQIRNILREDYATKVKNYDVVIICLPAIIDKTFEDIQTELKFAFNKLKLI